MKKTYIIPQIDEVKLVGTVMMDSTSPGTTPIDTSTEIDAGDSDSRAFYGFAWDDADA